MNEALFALIFFSVFHIPGGFALGRGLRQLIRGPRTAILPFLFIWGSLFGGIPLFIGAAIFVASGAGYIVIAQVAIFATAILLGAFLPEEYLAAFITPGVAQAAFGGLFMLIGSGLLIFFATTDWGVALVGILFALVGGAVLISTLASTLRNTDEVHRE